MTATFAGSESHFSSTGTTRFLVGSATSAQVTPPTTPEPAVQPAAIVGSATAYIPMEATVVIIIRLFS